MSLPRRHLLGLAASAGLLSRSRASAAERANAPAGGTLAGTAQNGVAQAALVQRDEFIPLWPQGLPDPVPPGLTEEIIERATAGAPLRDRIARHVVTPGLTLRRASRPDGSVALIVPGGAYQHVVIDKEGLEIADWLAARGTTAAVLRYRLPGDGWRSGPDAPLQDAQRAVRWLRANGAALRADSARIGAIGCSAGGHLTARLLTGSTFAGYTARDDIDRASARPDFGALLYPVILVDGPDAHATSAQQLLGNDRSPTRLERYSPDRHVDAVTPPTWLLHAADDAAVPLSNTLAFHAALRAHAIASELHVFESGGHGFGLRFTVGKPVAAWPELLRAWLGQHGFVRETARA